LIKKEKIQPVILAAVMLIAVVLTAACTGTESRAPQPAPVATFLPGQLLQSFGDVTGQGSIPPQGVPRAVLDSITFTIGLTPGTKTIDLKNISVVYADAIRTQTLTSIEGLRGEPLEGTWGILSITHQAGNSNDRLEFDEQATIRINPATPIVPGQLITIVVKPKEGQPLTLRRIVSSTVMPGENILLAA
jgi:archaellin